MYVVPADTAWEGGKSQLLFSFLWHQTSGDLRGGWCRCHYSLRTVETRLTTSAFAGMGKAGLQFFLQCFTGAVQLLSNSFLSCQLPISLFFGYRAGLFCLVWIHWQLWVAGFFSSKSGICEAKRKQQEHITSGPEVSNQSGPEKNQSSVGFIYNVRVFSFTWWKE